MKHYQFPMHICDTHGNCIIAQRVPINPLQRLSVYYFDINTTPPRIAWCAADDPENAIQAIMRTPEFRKKLQGIITANDFVYRRHKPYLPFHEDQFLLRESRLYPGHHTITIPEYGIVATFDKERFNGHPLISTFHDTPLTNRDISFWQHIIMLYFLKYAQHEIPWLRTFIEKVDSHPVY